MDTISRENNSSMLPVGGIIVGVVALLLAGYAAITLSKINKTIAAQEEKIARIDGLETQITSVSGDVASVRKTLGGYGNDTNTAFSQIAAALKNYDTEIATLKEATKKPAAPSGGKAGGSTPAVAGPDEYIVKAGDSSGTKIATANGISIADLMAVNPDVDWRKLKPGQKLKLPAKR